MTSSPERHPDRYVRIDAVAATRGGSRGRPRATAGARVIEALEHQPRARISLEAALRDDHALSHAYLFHGPAGSGKRAAARAFAAALISAGADDPEDAARRVMSGVHPTSHGSSRAARTTSWSTTCVPTSCVRRRCARSSRSERVFVIVDADRMNDESQNSLLKTLEEPASFAHYVLVSSAPGRLLETIPSRCRPVRFGAVPPARIAEALQAEGVPADTALACARLSGGDADRARALAGPEAPLRREAEARRARRPCRSTRTPNG